MTFAQAVTEAARLATPKVAYAVYQHGEHWSYHPHEYGYGGVYIATHPGERQPNRADPDLIEACREAVETAARERFRISV